VDPKDVVNVLHNMISGVRTGGVILDLQVIRPDPRVELVGELICDIDGSALFEKADAATAAVDAAISDGRLIGHAVDDHDVRSHYPTGLDLVEDFEGKLRKIPEHAVSGLRQIGQPVVIRERCRLRRLERVSASQLSRGRAGIH
jgi:hypothetical protein